MTALPPSRNEARTHTTTRAAMALWVKLREIAEWDMNGPFPHAQTIDVRELVAIEEEAVSEYREALAELVALTDGWEPILDPTSAWAEATAKARSLLQADQVAAAEPRADFGEQEAATGWSPAPSSKKGRSDD